MAQGVARGEVRAAARVCRLVDDRAPGHDEVLRALWPTTGRAWVIGVTGNPGAGKSTLVDRLIGAFRASGEKVGVVAVDPTSPFTGGAILGDRIRMQRHFEDDGVFIRSIATRGALGGLSRSAADLVRVLDAWGAGVVLVETVGVGQDELEVTRTAHTTLVVASPGLGDEIQAIKAGLLECADVFAVNKADRDGADATVRDLELMIALGGEALVAAARRGLGHGAAAFRPGAPTEARDAAEREWTPPIVKCVATTGVGLPALMSALGAHHRWSRETPLGEARRREREERAIADFLTATVTDAWLRRHGASVEAAARRVVRRETDPWAEAAALSRHDPE
ncbi:MAG: methylmalonyl Co-A mutase-associated GTPase MeaB [Polyangiaceae bacterium]|nr:methylmalonyl Co-A mutase-associated GTPase MeaB [Polyangiaceae bacterium]